MGSTDKNKTKVAIVHASLPAIEEIDQFRLINEHFDLTVITADSICTFLTENSWFKDLRCIALPDHDENTTYLPGLESVLKGFDIVIVKGRLGMFAYQALKAKWRNRFRLLCWVDNLTVMPGEDLDRIRTIRNELTNMVDGFLVQSNSVARTLQLEGVETNRIIKFTPYAKPLATNKTEENKEIALTMLGLNKGDVVIGHTGNLEWEEDLLGLIHGARIAIDKDQSLAKKLKIVFCAVGSYATQLKDRLTAIGLDRNAIFVSPSREATNALYYAADAIFYSTNDSIDRSDANPYRLISAMANGIPVIGCRTPIMEEILGKHRIDFCKGSPNSIAKAINKMTSAKALVSNIVRKNLESYNNRFSEDKIRTQMIDILNKTVKKSPTIDIQSLDHQVIEVESKVSNKQYLEAIDLIDSIFTLEDIPTYHKSNLYRLIGDSFTKLGDSEMGKNAYLQAVELDPFSPKAFIGLGTAAMTRSSYQSAIIHFQKAVALAPKDEMANLGLGLAFQGLGEMNEASKWMVNALEVNSENTAAIFSLVKVCQELNEYEAAENALRTYITNHPYDHNMVFSLAGVLYAENRHEEVINLLEDIIKINPKDVRAISLRNQSRSQLANETSKGNVG